MSPDTPSESGGSGIDFHKLRYFNDMPGEGGPAHAADYEAPSGGAKSSKVSVPAGGSQEIPPGAPAQGVKEVRLSTAMEPSGPSGCWKATFTEIVNEIDWHQSDPLSPPTNVTGHGPTGTFPGQVSPG